MHPTKVDRQHLEKLTDLPNIGPAMAADLTRLGYATPAQLAGADPEEMYLRLCALDGQRHDPCVLDVFVSVTRFLAGEPAQPWWVFSGERRESVRRRR